MAYSDDAVKAKLSTLNETQESIVTVAQWIMFHRRHADRTATLWLERVKDSNAGKRLNLIYLANEVVQQSKARKRDDFLIAFSPFVPEAVAIAFKGTSADIRGKIKRVVEVWRQRAIFDESIQSAVETRMKEIESSSAPGGKKLLGGSLFSGSPGPGPSAPAELKPLIPLQEAVTKSEMGQADLITQVEKDTTETSELSSVAVPVRIARYNKALKTLSQADNAVTNSIKVRKSLLEELEKLVDTNREALAKLEDQHDYFAKQSAEIQVLKEEDEDSIMRRLPRDEDDEPDEPDSNGSATAHPEPERPTADDLTPPPVEDFTPMGSPEPDFDAVNNGQQLDGAGDSAWDPATLPGADLMASLSRPFSSTDMAAEETANKKARFEQPVPVGFGGGIPGLSDDVDELIKSEGGGL